MLGMILLTVSRGNPLVFWLSEIVLLVVVWRVIASRLDRRAAALTGGDQASHALGVVTAASAVAFLALWFFAVVFARGEVGLLATLAYVVSSGALLFLVSIRTRLTRVDYPIRMPLLVAGTVSMIAIGLLYLGGATL